MNKNIWNLSSVVLKDYEAEIMYKFKLKTIYNDVLLAYNDYEAKIERKNGPGGVRNVREKK